jgi:hypothetical protein
MCLRTTSRSCSCLVSEAPPLHCFCHKGPAFNRFRQVRVDDKVGSQLVPDFKTRPPAAELKSPRPRRRRSPASSRRSRSAPHQWTRDSRLPPSESNPSAPPPTKSQTQARPRGSPSRQNGGIVLDWRFRDPYDSDSCSGLTAWAGRLPITVPTGEKGMPMRLALACCLGTALFVSGIADARTISQLRKLYGSGIDAEDRFGIGVALSGDTLAVGSYGYDYLVGSVHIFERNRTTPHAWSESKLITPAERADGGFFGWSAALGERSPRPSPTSP